MRIHVHVFPLLLFGAAFLAPASALEVNYWPLFTGERDEEGRLQSAQILGPILFAKRNEPAFPDGNPQNIDGVRPLFVRFTEQEKDRASFHLLYPLFNLRQRPYGTSWDVFTLLRSESFTPGSEREREDSASGAGISRSFQLFPILFWKDDPDPDRSYLGIFPIAGEVQNVFGYDEITWLLFPLTARMIRGDVTTHAMPWPFIRVVRGPETRGFHLWPIYGNVTREEVSSHRYWLWPLGYHVQRELSKEEPYEAFGFLPFYSSSSSERAVSSTFIWPFFGYTDSHDPEYHETRYFWPLFVQRRGASYRNRWAPFYTRSTRSGTDTRWIMWPLHRSSTWEQQGLRNKRSQFLYFLYWSNVQSSTANPELAPAIKQHVWPFYSYWDDGAGRRQFQTLSPFEVFFPFNDIVRQKYSPLFAFYRMDIETGVRSRHSFLFDFITLRSEVEPEEFYLNIGPLASYESGPQERQWELLKGLVSYSREGDDRSFGALWINRPERANEPEKKQPVPAVRRLRRGVQPRRTKRSRSLHPTRTPTVRPRGKRATRLRAARAANP